MSKKPVTYIAISALESLVEASGLPVVEKAGWLKVMGAKGRRLYIPRLKSVGRIDLVGLDEAPGAIAAGEMAHGSVTSIMDMRLERTADEILADFAGCLEALAELPELPAKPRGPRAAKAEPVTEVPEAVLARVALIKKVAKEKGLPVSASSLAADKE